MSIVPPLAAYATNQKLKEGIDDEQGRGYIALGASVPSMKIPDPGNPGGDLGAGGQTPPGISSPPTPIVTQPLAGPVGTVLPGASVTQSQTKKKEFNESGKSIDPTTGAVIPAAYGTGQGVIGTLDEVGPLGILKRQWLYIIIAGIVVVYYANQ